MMTGEGSSLRGILGGCFLFGHLKDGLCLKKREEEQKSLEICALDHFGVICSCF